MSASVSTIQLEKARFNMVEQQVRTWDVLDYRVLDALHHVPRELFVETEHAAMAYADTELPVPGASGGEKLFKPVSFTSRGTAGEHGTGLGLLVCKEYIEKMGGSISFESREGEGTTFYCAIPQEALY